MSKYIAKENFSDGKDAKGGLIVYKKGEIYNGKKTEFFLGKGFIIDQGSIDLAQLEALEKKIVSAKAELSALQEKLKSQKSSSQEQEPNADEANPSIDEEESQDDFDLGEDEGLVPPSGLSGKALSKWKKKHGVK